MTLLRKMYEFDVQKDDLVIIYTLYIRSILEYNSNVWFSNITEEEREDLERVQRVACKIILKGNYISYELALAELNLQTLSERRLMLAERFAKKCVKSEQFNDLFPKNINQNVNLRNTEKYNVKFASTGRLMTSSIPAMQRLLNQAL